MGVLKSAGAVGVALLAAVTVTLPCIAADEGEAPVAVATPSALPAPTTAKIVVKGAGTFGGDLDMVTRVYQPTGTPPFPVVLYSHGRAGDPTVRAKLVRPVANEQLRYWLGRGFAVVAPIRPGYGETGGRDAELSHARFEGAGSCPRRPAYTPTAAAGARATMAALDWIGQQAWADSSRVILVGQSVGGLVTVATAAQQPKGVIAYVNFAGGTGGDPDISPGRSCDPDQLTELYGNFGTTTTVPNLWVYALNDQYWGPDVPQAWHTAFAAGGSPTQFIHAPPVAGGNGHGLSGHSRALWAPYLDAFLEKVGVNRP